MKAKRLIVFALLATLVLSMLACEDGGKEAAPTPTPTATPTPTPTPTPSPTPEYDTYTDQEHDFSISYPWDWVIPPEEQWKVTRKVIENGIREIGRFLACEAPTSCVGAIPLFTVECEELPYHIPVQDYFDSAIIHKYRQLEQWTAISTDEITVDEWPALRHVYTSEYDGDTVNQMDVLLVKGKIAWRICFWVEPACWSEYEPSFDEIAGSFDLMY